MTPAIHDLVSLYSLGILEDSERLSFEEHLRDCRPCQAELRELNQVTADIGLLGAAATPVPPPAGLKDRLLAKVRETPQRPGFVFHEGGILLERSGEIPWRQIRENVEAKILYVDRERRYNTSLVRIAPGGKYPSHRHRDIEQIFILSGDLRIEDTVARAGDYCRAEADSTHGESYSEHGCVFLVVASQKDEILK